MLFPATAVLCNHLLPIDGITDASEPFVERFSNAMCLGRPASARGISPLRHLFWCSAPEHALSVPILIPSNLRRQPVVAFLALMTYSSAIGQAIHDMQHFHFGGLRHSSRDLSV